MATKEIKVDPDKVLWAILKAFYTMGGSFRIAPNIILGWIANRIRSESKIKIEEDELKNLLEEYSKIGLITKADVEGGLIEYRFNNNILRSVAGFKNPKRIWPENETEEKEFFSESESPIELDPNR